MKVAVVGGGPAGLYFSLLLKKAVPAHDVVVLERDRADATYGWGVVFSEGTLSSFREADYKTYQQIIDNFIIWDAIDVRYGDGIVRCGGQVFSGISRKLLLGLLQSRCAEVGVRVEFEREIGAVSELESFDLVVAADGVRSVIREAHAPVFRPRLAYGSSRYIWLGTTRPFDSFTFVFRSNEDGFFQAHAYPFDGSAGTFIVECDEKTWRGAGLDQADEAESIAYCEKLFEKDLRGHALMSNNSKWISFATLTNRTWHHGNIVLVGDAAHTAHFSIGSGTKLAMEDSIALVDALEKHAEVEPALSDYELERKPRVERLQEAARQSQAYFENTARYRHMEPLQFAFHLLSRSGRIDYTDLRVRDEHFVGAVDRWFAAGAEGDGSSLAVAAPPAFTPWKLGGTRLANRIVVAATPAYGARAGVPVPGVLEGPARSGAGLVMTDIVAVSEPARITPGCSGIYRPEHETAWKHEIERTRAISDAALAMTLGHSGPRAATRARFLAADMPLEPKQGWMPVAASPLPYTPRSVVPAEIDRRRMDEVLEDFVSAAGRARAAGFDMVEVHMAHGYLLGTFISPLTNRRADDLGGPLTNRLRYPLEVLEAVRAEWPSHLPVGVALCVSDWASGGLAIDEAVEAARAFRDLGCDVIRVLAGQTVARYRPQYDPYFMTSYADRLRNEASVATIATGDITTVDHVNTIVAGGRADMCLLRPIPFVH